MMFRLVVIALLMVSIGCSDDESSSAGGEEVSAVGGSSTGDTDFDGDGVPNNEDACPFVPDPEQADADGDGQGDLCDVDNDNDGVIDTEDSCLGLANPDRLDTDDDGVGDACDDDDDGDGVPDEDDLCPKDADDGGLDTDGDGLGDVCDFDVDGDEVRNENDNCISVANTGQADLDFDGLGDGCDPDTDGDDIPDDPVAAVGGAEAATSGDNCPMVVNMDQLDLDEDGVGDACDMELDGDGIVNASDNCPRTPNSMQEDADGDGQGDACDICPLDPDNDIDGDNICGDGDNCLLVPNFAQLDLDEDGLGDECDVCPSDPLNDDDGDAVCYAADNCPDVANTLEEFPPGSGILIQIDSDGDGIGDPCDPCSLDPQNDLDDDGICGDVDICPALNDPEQLDSDGDGTGDGCDVCPGDADNDADGDGRCADEDNCPNIGNDQTDTDGDGIGDACDECDRFGPTDPDGDALCAEADNCPSVANEDQVDTDGDGYGDACDICPEDVANTDRDGNGEINVGEDADGDGFCMWNDPTREGHDLCPSRFDLVQSDGDGDGIGDGCDDDRDGDGINDDEDNCPGVPNPVQETAEDSPYGDACSRVYYAQDFEDNDLDLTGSGLSFDEGRWVLEPEGGRDGSVAIRNTLEATDLFTLTIDSVDLSTADSPELRFWYRADILNPAYTGGQGKTKCFYIEASSVELADSIKPVVITCNGNTGHQFLQAAVDLSELAGARDVQIHFQTFRGAIWQNRWHPGSGVVLDDLVVREGPLSRWSTDGATNASIYPAATLPLFEDFENLDAWEQFGGIWGLSAEHWDGEYSAYLGGQQTRYQGIAALNYRSPISLAGAERPELRFWMRSKGLDGSIALDQVYGIGEPVARPADSGSAQDGVPDGGVFVEIRYRLTTGRVLSRLYYPRVDLVGETFQQYRLSLADLVEADVSEFYMSIIVQHPDAYVDGRERDFRQPEVFIDSLTLDDTRLATANPAPLDVTFPSDNIEEQSSGWVYAEQPIGSRVLRTEAGPVQVNANYRVSLGTYDFSTLEEPMFSVGVRYDLSGPSADGGAGASFVLELATTEEGNDGSIPLEQVRLTSEETTVQCELPGAVYRIPILDAAESGLENGHLETLNFALNRYGIDFSKPMTVALVYSSGSQASEGIDVEHVYLGDVVGAESLDASEGLAWDFDLEIPRLEQMAGLWAIAEGSGVGGTTALRLVTRPTFGGRRSINRVALPAMDISRVMRPRLSFSFRSVLRGWEQSIVVRVSSPGYPSRTYPIDTSGSSVFATSSSGYQRIAIPLDDFGGARGVKIEFVGEAPSQSAMDIVIDDVSVDRSPLDEAQLVVDAASSYQLYLNGIESGAGAIWKSAEHFAPRLNAGVQWLGFETNGGADLIFGLRFGDKLWRSGFDTDLYYFDTALEVDPPESWLRPELSASLVADGWQLAQGTQLPDQDHLLLDRAISGLRFESPGATNKRRFLVRVDVRNDDGDDVLDPIDLCLGEDNRDIGDENGNGVGDAYEDRNGNGLGDGCTGFGDNPEVACADPCPSCINIALGKKVCAGQLNAESTAPGIGVELCDGKDNDCDGNVDEECPAVEEACDSIDASEAYDSEICEDGAPCRVVDGALGCSQWVGEPSDAASPESVIIDLGADQRICSLRWFNSCVGRPAAVCPNPESCPQAGGVHTWRISLRRDGEDDETVYDWAHPRRALEENLLRPGIGENVYGVQYAPPNQMPIVLVPRFAGSETCDGDPECALCGESTAQRLSDCPIGRFLRFEIMTSNGPSALAELEVYGARFNE